MARKTTLGDLVVAVIEAARESARPGEDAEVLAAIALVDLLGPSSFAID